MPPLFLLLSLILLTTPSQAQNITLDKQQASTIGTLIFQNECGGKDACLTSWNRGEAFPSLGIGHFIWYPAGITGPFQESFPKLIQFMQARNTQIPSWLSRAIQRGAPWPSREAFSAAQHSRKMQQLRALLSGNKDIQIAFMVRRLNQALPRILATLPDSEHEHIKQQFHRIASAPMGYYALIDYVNFKGEGVKISERYQGYGWGLLQVLEAMEEGKNPLLSFSQAADRVLTRRVQLSPAKRNEQRWLSGWKKRVRTYSSPLTSL